MTKIYYTSIYSFSNIVSFLQRIKEIYTKNPIILHLYLNVSSKILFESEFCFDISHIHTNIDVVLKNKIFSNIKCI